MIVRSQSGLVIANDRMKSIAGTSATALSQTAVAHTAHRETRVAGATGEGVTSTGDPREKREKGGIRTDGVTATEESHCVVSVRSTLGESEKRRIQRTWRRSSKNSGPCTRSKCGTTMLSPNRCTGTMRKTLSTTLTASISRAVSSL